MPAGNGGREFPVCAAAAAAFAWLNVKTAAACGIAAYVTVVETPVGRLATVGTCSPEMLFASAALVTTCSWGCFVHEMVPYALSCDSDCMSARVTGTVVSVWGVKMLSPDASAVASNATAATAAANASIIGREPGRSTGSRNPKVGRAAGADRTRLKADATSTLRSGAVIRLVMARASSDTVLYRAWHSAQVSKWRASAPL